MVAAFDLLFYFRALQLNILSGVLGSAAASDFQDQVTSTMVGIHPDAECREIFPFDEVEGLYDGCREVL